jgi:hypothetical protein
MESVSDPKLSQLLKMSTPFVRLYDQTRDFDNGLCVVWIALVQALQC